MEEKNTSSSADLQCSVWKTNTLRSQVHICILELFKSLAHVGPLHTSKIEREIGNLVFDIWKEEAHTSCMKCNFRFKWQKLLNFEELPLF